MKVVIAEGVEPIEFSYFIIVMTLDRLSMPSYNGCSKALHP